jgi:hypothetical protein
MSESVERTSLDLRYQAYRLRNDAAEARLLASIAERDIEQPLAGVDTPQARLLLDGFKRYRCATKLGIECVPYVSLGDEEAMGIASLMRVASGAVSVGSLVSEMMVTAALGHLWLRVLIAEGHLSLSPQTDSQHSGHHRQQGEERRGLGNQQDRGVAGNMEKRVDRLAIR